MSAVVGAGLARFARRAEQRNVPLSVLVEITGRCNLDCQHCYLDIHDPPEELSTEQWLRAFDQLRAAGALFLTISGGEVFLRKDLWTLLERAKSLGFAIRLNTSGTRIGRSEACRLAALGLATVELSLYSSRAAPHDAVTRRPGSWRKTVRAAAMLARLGVSVVLKAPVLTELTAVAGDYQGLLALAARLGRGRKAIAFKFDPGIIVRRDGNAAPAAHRPSAERLAEVLADPRVFGKDRPLPPPADPDEAPCAVGRRTARIGPDGSVYPCSTFPTAVGNLRQQTFEQIWHGGSPLLAWLRSLRFSDLGTDCAGCGKSGYCNRCLALGLIEHGDWRAPVVESCRLAHAHDLASENGAPLPAGLLPAGATADRRRLPLLNAKN